VKIEDALIGITTIAFDTAPLIYFVEKHAVYAPIMRSIIQKVDSDEILSFSSVITLTEVLTLPKRVGNQTLERQYTDLLLNSKNFTLIDITPEIAENGADFRARYNLRTPDALQIASAVVTGCQAFLTNDLTIKRVNEITILVLSELEL
jgi:predicted nucleic acid-binding protein